MQAQQADIQNPLAKLTATDVSGSITDFLAGKKGK
jgi:hypothetical protein